MHHNITRKNCTEDLDQRGYTHYAASYTSSLMHNIQRYTEQWCRQYNKNNNVIHVLHACTAYCKCQPCGLTSAGRGHIKTKTYMMRALPDKNAIRTYSCQTGDAVVRPKNNPKTVQT